MILKKLKIVFEQIYSIFNNLLNFRSEAQLKEWREETRKLQEYRRQNYDAGNLLTCQVSSICKTYKRY